MVKLHHLLGLFFAGVVLLGGCATPKQVADQTVNMSMAIDQANNRMLLLNVVRAYYRSPMQFFRVNALHGQAGVGNFDIGIQFPLGSYHNASEGYPIAPLTYHQTQPSFDLTLLDSQEFMQGITTPISPERMAYFLEQGWPFELLFYLMVRSITIVPDDVPAGVRSPVKLVNYPQDSKQFEAFARFVHGIRGCRFIVEEAKEKYGPAVRIGPDFPIDKLAGSRTKDLKLEAADKSGLFQLIEKEASPSVSFKCPDKTKVVVDDTHVVTFSMQQRNFSTKSNLNAKSDDDAIVFRSVEAMVYYLGELTRQLNGDPSSGVECGAVAKPIEIELGPMRSTERSPLFVLACDGATPLDELWSVTYGGHTFGIPARALAAGSSTHVLSLITQLVGLQNKATASPVTGTVRLVQ